MSYQIITQTDPVNVGTSVSTSTTESLTINSSYDTSTTTPVYINTSLSSSTSQQIHINTLLTTSALGVSISPVLNGTIIINVSKDLLYYNVGSSVSVSVETDPVSDQPKSFDGNIQFYNASIGELTINNIKNIIGSPFPSTSDYTVSVVDSRGSISFYIPQHLLFYSPGNSISITNLDSSDNVLLGKINTYDYESGLLEINRILQDEFISTFTSKVSTNIESTSIIPPIYLPLSLNVSNRLLYYAPGNSIKITDSTDPNNYLDGTIESYDYESGALVVIPISVSQEFLANAVFNLSVSPKNSRIPMFISPGLKSYIPGNSVTVVQKLSNSNYLNGYIESYDSESGKIVINNNQNIQGSFDVLSDNYINLSLVHGGKLTLPIQKGLSFSIGYTVYVSDSTNPSNNFAGFVEEYSIGTGSLTINNIQNINGSFISTVIYNVILSTPFPVNTTQAYKSVSEPIIPVPTVSNPNYDYPRETADVPSVNYGYSKLGWNTRMSLNNPVRGFSMGQSSSFSRNLSLPRR